MPPSVTFVTVCPLGTEWLLISANCLWVKLRPLCTLPLQLGDTTSLLQATPGSMWGDTECGSLAGEMLFSDNSFSAARCGDASRVPRQLSFRWSTSLWLHWQRWETNDLEKSSKAIELLLDTEYVQARIQSIHTVIHIQTHKHFCHGAEENMLTEPWG